MRAQAELQRYLRSKSAFDRPLHEVRKRYERDATLRASIPLVTADEIAAFRLLGCRRVDRGRLHFADLDAALRASRFEVGLLEALGEYFGVAIRTRAESSTAEEQRWDAFVAGLRAESNGADPVLRWLERDERYIRQEWSRAHETPGDGLQVAVRALRNISPDSDGVPLPAFANQVAGDPHALDLGTPARRYFERALLTVFPDVDAPTPLTAEGRAALLEAAGLIIDEISSTVTVANLDGEGPFLGALRESGMAVALPLLTIRNLGPVRAPFDTVFAVENPAVFRIILDALHDVPQGLRPTILCTSGQLSIAARRLLDDLVRAGATIKYSGDFDPAGLTIARKLATRYGAAFEFWRLDRDAYRAAVRTGTPDIAEYRLHGLRSTFPELAAAIAEHGAAYQEAISDMLVADILAFVSAGPAVTARPQSEPARRGMGGGGPPVQLPL